MRRTVYFQNTTSPLELDSKRRMIIHVFDDRQRCLPCFDNQWRRSAEGNDRAELNAQRSRVHGIKLNRGNSRTLQDSVLVYRSHRALRED